MKTNEVAICTDELKLSCETLTTTPPNSKEMDGQADECRNKGDKVASIPKRTLKMVMPHLVSLVVGKSTIKEVATTLEMTEAEVNKQVLDTLGPILKEMGGIAKKLEGAAAYFSMMEKKPERREVLMDMLKDDIEESCASLNQMAAKA